LEFGPFYQVKEFLILGNNFWDLIIPPFTKKILFALGFLSQLNPAYYPRPHWFLLWLLYGFYCIYQIKNRKSPTYSVFLFNALIIGFYVLNILFVTIDSYGFRAFLPFQFLFIGIAFLSVDKLFSLFKREEKL
jgi:hypothetical protein